MSKAARLLLIQATLAALPIHNMQLVRLLVSIVRDLESISRRFLWGAGTRERKLHPIRWDIVCTPKEEGGLGIPQLKVTNEAFLVKLAWRILKEPQSLCSQVMGSKYGGWRAIAHGQAVRQSSVIWRDIHSIHELLSKGARWRVVNGEDVLFWKDRWLREVPLLDAVFVQLSEGV